MNDNAFKALANEQRRTLLLDLLESNPQSVPMQTEMYHVHLPILEDCGYIEWDEDTGTVIRGPRFDDIRPLLEFVAADDTE